MEAKSVYRSCRLRAVGSYPMITAFDRISTDFQAWLQRVCKSIRKTKTEQLTGKESKKVTDVGQYSEIQELAFVTTLNCLSLDSRVELHECICELPAVA